MALTKTNVKAEVVVGVNYGQTLFNLGAFIRIVVKYPVVQMSLAQIAVTNLKLKQ